MLMMVAVPTHEVTNDHYRVLNSAAMSTGIHAEIEELTMEVQLLRELHALVFHDNAQRNKSSSHRPGNCEAFARLFRELPHPARSVLRAQIMVVVLSRAQNPYFSFL